MALILVVNLLTQGALNLGLNWYAYKNGTMFLFLPYLLMELGVVLAEGGAYLGLMPGGRGGGNNSPPMRWLPTACRWPWVGCWPCSSPEYFNEKEGCPLTGGQPSFTNRGNCDILNQFRIPYAPQARLGDSIFSKEVSMKKIILAFLLLALLLPAVGCAAQEEKERVTVVATTYPIYLFARAVTDGTEGVVVERLDTGSASCLHDYTLSMADMKKLERADLIALNGAGLEDFLSDALATSDAEVVDCSAGAELLENLSHDHKEGDEDHDHGHYDPHYWMDPASVPTMLDNLVRDLFKLCRVGASAPDQYWAGR